MSADPRTLAAALRRSNGPDETGYQDGNGRLAYNAADLIDQVVVPLHDAWLKANPPCPTCDGKTWSQFDPADETSPAVPCPDCSDGVLPFDKWTAGLVVDDDVFDDRVRDALIDAHNQGVEEGRDPWNKLSMFDIDRIALACAVRLRQIGGAR